ncbi:hypothetical protein C8J56DRAFT_903439 [Mycena floridula]|nr:hypothetical protein C8J56DRAFT_903439 [Mycena floridula]
MLKAKMFGDISVTYVTANLFHEYWTLTRGHQLTTERSYGSRRCWERRRWERRCWRGDVGSGDVDVGRLWESQHLRTYFTDIKEVALYQTINRKQDIPADL